MNTLYIFVYNEGLGSRFQVAKLLDKIKEVIDWRFDIPNCFLLISSFTADELTDYIMEHAEVQHPLSFLVSEINKENVQGWLSKEAWDFINSNI